MKPIPTQEENPKGLHQRYIISKTNGDTMNPNAEYFILRVDPYGTDPVHIAACRKAVICYANEIRDHLPELSKDLIDRYSDRNDFLQSFFDVMNERNPALVKEIIDSFDISPNG